MEERYEIKNKIGQGGLGAVYRAHDIRMNREVAIKRILASSQDSYIPEEGTRQLIKEAGALASLQHPNIVTIYDVGTDEDGPFVVMELLTGDTLEGIISQGSFTWQDFRQLAMQTLEALIAAQELHLVHRDLKPSNIMLTWLPSGKFQVKIVDFGLAKLSAKPSLQTIDQSDGVFGSIYFMAPEQFERVPIDLKTDLYAIGCVFYYSLTGTYPFDGETAAEVMASHLQHHVTPLQEVRKGIPLWLCDWIMWHLNRQPTDRPESARQSLQYFVENDIAQPNPEMSIGTPAPAVEKAKRPKLVIPGSIPVPEIVSEMTPTQRVKTAAAPKPLLPPEGSKPSIHTTAQVLQSARSEEVTPLSAEESEPNPKPVEESAPETKPTKDSAPVEAKTGPPPPTLARATPAAKSSAPALKRATSGAATAQAPISAPATSGDANPQASNVNLATDEKKAPSPPKKKRAISNSVKVMIAVVLGILAVFLGIFFLQKSGKNAEAKLYNEMIAQASQNGATDVSVNKRKLQILLNSSVSVASNNDRANVYIALVFAKATDDTNVDSMIAEFATTQEMNHEIRVKLLGDVLGRRKNPAVIGTLLDFAVSTKETKAAIAAVEASRNMATDAHFAAFLEILKTTKNESIRRASEGTLANIILKSTSPASLADSLANAYSNASDDTIRHSILRLVARAGGAKAVELVKTNLQSEDVKDKIAAIVALGNWADQEGYTVLLDHISKETNLQLRARAFDSALLYARQSNGNTQEIWTMLSGQAKTLKEQLDLIRGLANVSPEPWNFAMLQNFVATGDNNDVVDLAEKVIIHLKDIQKVRGSKDDE